MHMCRLGVGSHWLKLDYGQLFQREKTTPVKAGGQTVPWFDRKTDINAL